MFCSIFFKETLWTIQFFNAAKLLLGDSMLFSMCLTNPLRKVMQNMVISGSAVKCSEEEQSQTFKEIGLR